ncbi:MAG TPA: AsmA family protein [Candidatus Angelobacter sp.]
MKRLLIIAGIVVGVLVLAVLLVPLFINVDSFRPELETKLSAALNRQVQVGKLEASIFSGGAAAENISIADDPAFNKGPFLQASSLKVGLRLLPLVFSRRLSVSSITVEKPDIVLLKNQAGRWNYSSLGGSSTAKTSSASSSAAPEFSVDKFEIVNGTVRVGQSSSHSATRERVYQNVHLVADNISLSSAMPFTLTAATPGGGALNLEGQAGPIDHEDSAKTPLNAQIGLRHIDLGATGLLDPSSGLGGTVDFDGKVNSDGHHLHAEGKANASGLKLIKGGAAAKTPVSFDYTSDYGLDSDTGTINANVHAGNSTATASGTVDTHEEDPVAHLTLKGKAMAVNDIAGLLPSLGVLMPQGASLQGGVANMDMTAEGPLDRLVIAGPLNISNAHLIGYNLNSKLGAVAAFSGIKPSNDTLIQTASSGLRVAPEGLRADNIVLDVPSMGSLTGSGIINSSNALNFQMVLKLSSGAGNTLGTLAGLANGGQNNGIPFLIEGTTANPQFRPNFGGGKGLQNALLGGNGQKGDNGQQQGLGGILGGMLNKKKKPQ